MTQPVDLTNLREMTDGDSEMEKELFEEFFLSSDACIAGLDANTAGGENEAWRKHAHALKGTALNLGAESLSAVCKHAQESHGASAEEKHAMLASIKAEYARVKDYLTSL